ncbi:MAG: 3-isopropylmalate dehydrogenase [Saprospiraceae bacterium]|nr:3-isopropylmalate dehydrogenase [Saprospiraceae bacterium]
MDSKIAVLPGDGIGPEVIGQALKVLNAIADRFNHQFTYSYGDVGGVAIDKTGSPLPDETLNTLLNSDAVLFGAIGDPKYDNDPTAKVRPEQGLLGMRKALGLFCNIRPVTIFENLRHLSPIKESYLKGVDMVIYRELIGGIYFGPKGRSEDNTSAYDTCVYKVAEIERIAHLAFQQAGNRRKKVTLIDKANVLESSRLWREHVQIISKDYPEIETDYMFVDNAAMQMIINPAQFDVILTSNMFGDIISDESSVLVGSLGLLPSASIGSATSVFEPIHGSYPQGAGKDIANPVATVLSAGLLLDHLGLVEEGNLVRGAVSRLLEAGLGTPDLQGLTKISCSKAGDYLEALVSDDDLVLDAEKLGESSSTII